MEVKKWKEKKLEPSNVTKPEFTSKLPRKEKRYVRGAAKSSIPFLSQKLEEYTGNKTIVL